MGCGASTAKGAVVDPVAEPGKEKQTSDGGKANAQEKTEISKTEKLWQPLEVHIQKEHNFAYKQIVPNLVISGGGLEESEKLADLLWNKETGLPAGVEELSVRTVPSQVLLDFGLPTFLNKLRLHASGEPNQFSIELLVSRSSPSGPWIHHSHLTEITSEGSDGKSFYLFGNRAVDSSSLASATGGAKISEHSGGCWGRFWMVTFTHTQSQGESPPLKIKRIDWFGTKLPHVQVTHVSADRVESNGIQVQWNHPIGHATHFAVLAEKLDDNKQLFSAVVAAANSTSGKHSAVLSFKDTGVALQIRVVVVESEVSGEIVSDGVPSDPVQVRRLAPPSPGGTNSVHPVSPTKLAYSHLSSFTVSFAEHVTGYPHTPTEWTAMQTRAHPGGRIVFDFSLPTQITKLHWNATGLKDGLRVHYGSTESECWAVLGEIGPTEDGEGVLYVFGDHTTDETAQNHKSTPIKLAEGSSTNPCARFWALEFLGNKPTDDTSAEPSVTLSKLQWFGTKLPAPVPQNVGVNAQAGEIAWNYSTKADIFKVLWKTDTGEWVGVDVSEADARASPSKYSVRVAQLPQSAQPRIIAIRGVELGIPS
ncbi:hypothetical protein BJ742DRAFT_744695 [Cladochytrium replicatum]|nr:hypothetical protein BJ742DRAFT_744695 [Cladochytrium replicatum]